MKLTPAVIGISTFSQTKHSDAAGRDLLQSECVWGRSPSRLGPRQLTTLTVLHIMFRLGGEASKSEQSYLQPHTCPLWCFLLPALPVNSSATSWTELDSIPTHTHTHSNTQSYHIFHCSHPLPVGMYDNSVQPCRIITLRQMALWKGTPSVWPNKLWQDAVMAKRAFLKSPDLTSHMQGATCMRCTAPLPRRE